MKTLLYIASAIFALLAIFSFACVVYIASFNEPNTNPVIIGGCVQGLAQAALFFICFYKAVTRK